MGLDLYCVVVDGVMMGPVIFGLDLVMVVVVDCKFGID